jgi:hypothetical protein
MKRFACTFDTSYASGFVGTADHARDRHTTDKSVRGSIPPEPHVHDDPVSWPLCGKELRSWGSQRAESLGDCQFTEQLHHVRQHHDQYGLRMRYGTTTSTS